MRIIHILPTRSLEFGGPIPVAEAYVKCLQTPETTADLQPSKDKSIFNNLLNIWKGVRASDIVHIHCLWNLYGSWAALIARVNNISYVITPHGMLDKWSLSKSRIKKIIFWLCIEKRNIKNAAFIHFLNEEERNEAFTFIPKVNNFIIPNGVFLENYLESLPQKGLAKNNVYVIFLGRVHPKKGFDLLFPAFAHALLACPRMHLLIAGPGEKKYISKLSNYAYNLGIEKNISFLGMLSGQRKIEILSKSDFFVLPSHQEGDSIAIKEAMACGLPVLITPACHFTEIEINSAGMVIEPNIHKWGEALIKMYSDSDVRIDMGKRAQELINLKYTWSKLSSNMLQYYSQVLKTKNE